METVHRGRQRALANTEHILDAAAIEAAAHGIDQLSLTKVARRAGLTSGATYARYDSADELAVELWLQRLYEPMQAAVAQAAEALRKPGTPIPEPFVASLVSPDPVVILGTQALVASLHVFELDDVIPRQVTGWLESLGCGPDADFGHRLSGLLGIAMSWGAALGQPLVGAPADAWALNARAHRALAAAPGPSMALTPVPPTQWRFDAAEPSVATDLFRAAVTVIAQVGVHRASLARIARRAGHSVSNVYALSESRSEFLAALCRRTLDSPDQELPEARPAARLAALTAGWLTPDSRVARRFTLELSLAAGHDPVLAEAFAAALTRWNQVARERAEALGADGIGEIERRIVPASRLTLHGLCLLEELTHTVHDIDWSRHFR